MNTASIFFPVLLLIMFFTASSSSASDNSVDNSIYADLLKKYVKNGIVDYQGFKNEEYRLDEYLKILENTQSIELSVNERFAFYINAYNAWTIKLVLTNYPGIKSIKELGSLFKSPWKKKICRIDRQLLSLDDIEHKILRPTFNDPRIHFAVNCASKGCPVLISEPYAAKTIERQLELSTQTFINDPQKNYLQGDTLYVSSIFKWYSQDFGNDVVRFVSKYASGTLMAELSAGTDKIKVRYLDYDWSLNGK
ncbi:MAG: DUF547 domain-containing protein [Desulfamplus sp.]|nr:DUF547 domain-containing protein [Desulfamplus sp.]